MPLYQALSSIFLISYCSNSLCTCQSNTIHDPRIKPSVDLTRGRNHQPMSVIVFTDCCVLAMMPNLRNAYQGTRDIIVVCSREENWFLDTVSVCGNCCMTFWSVHPEKRKLQQRTNVCRLLHSTRTRMPYYFLRESEIKSAQCERENCSRTLW